MICLKKCVACDGNIPPFDKSEIHKYLKKVDTGCKKNDDENFYLIKEFKFKNFKESQNFVNKVGNLAEEENYHPDISFDGAIVKLKFLHMLLKDLQKVILF